MKELTAKIEAIYTKMAQRERIIFFIALAMVFIALMDQIIIGPITSELKAIDNQIEAKEDSIRKDRKILSFHNRILKEYLQYSTYLDSGEFTQEEIIAALLKKIENLANQQLITIKNIQPGDIEEKPLFQIYKTGMECEGTLDATLSFMNLLEQSDYLFQIVHFTIGPKSKGSDIMKTSMDISRTLILKEAIDDVELPQDAPAMEIPAVTNESEELPEDLSFLELE